MKVHLCFYVTFFYFSLFSCDQTCDEYTKQINNETNEENSSKNIVTISNYKFPNDPLMTEIQKNVSCQCSKERFCLRKCCLEDSIISETQSCSLANSNQSFSVNKIPNLPTNEIKFIHGINCKNLLVKSTNNLKFLENGSVYIEDEFADLDEFCIDYFEDQGDIGIMKCTDNANSSEFKWYLSISNLCLLITIIVYASIDTLRNNMAGKILLGQAGTLLAYHGLDDARQLFAEKLTSKPFCLGLAFLQQFLNEASFTWLSVMGFDMFSNVKNNKETSSKNKGNDNQTLKKYGSYAFGAPLSMVAFTLLVEFCPPLAKFIPKPPIAKDCKLGKSLAGVVYNDSSIVATLFSNLWMFIKSALTLRKRNTNIKDAEDGSPCQSDSDLSLCTQFCLFVKLFAIMGINWLLQTTVNFVPALQSYSTLMLYVNSFEGVMIFFVFVCNRRVLFLINKKIYPTHIIFNETDNKRGHTGSHEGTSSCCFFLSKTPESTQTGQNVTEE